jgi:hypothetical protein
MNRLCPLKMRIQLKRERCIHSVQEDLNVRDILEDLGIGGKIILKWVGFHKKAKNFLANLTSQKGLCSMESVCYVLSHISILLL